MVLQSNDARNESHEEASPTIVATFNPPKPTKKGDLGYFCALELLVES